jgi:DNA-binding GntR family transcriptional regulator
MTKQNREELAYESIIKLILENRFKPGDFLLETDLSEKLQLSRTPVRHALAKLVAEGFLDKKKKKGCFIPSATPQDAKHVFYARERIEGLNAASAARYALDIDLEYLYQLIENEKEISCLDQKKWKRAYLKINENFHLGIAAMSHNKYLEKYCRNIFWRSHAYILFFDTDYHEETSLRQSLSPKQHIEITKAIENRNEEKAENLMKQHIRTTFEQLFVRM